MFCDKRGRPQTQEAIAVSGIEGEAAQRDELGGAAGGEDDVIEAGAGGSGESGAGLGEEGGDIRLELVRSV